MTSSPRLLINDYTTIDTIIPTILTTPYTALDTGVPSVRYRGTIVDFREGLDALRIIGWQRNIAQIRKIDFSLPTIISVRMNRDGIIQEIHLDRSFKGSKGLLCSQPYLNRILKTLLLGKTMDPSWLHLIKLENTHCFHVCEVLGALYSFWDSLLKQNHSSQQYTYEEEVIDSQIIEGSFQSTGLQKIHGRDLIHYQLILHDLMHKISFNQQGTLVFNQPVTVDFTLNEQVLFTKTIRAHNADFKDLTRILITCIHHLHHALNIDRSKKILHSNLQPQAFIGALIQATAIKLFTSNYTYTMHALTALQRSNGYPRCIGAIQNPKEAITYFPLFNTKDIA